MNPIAIWNQTRTAGGLMTAPLPAQTDPPTLERAQMRHAIARQNYDDAPKNGALLGGAIGLLVLLFL